MLRTPKHYHGMSSPWISQYLINVGETYGENITKVAPEKKAKRVQMIQRLTYPEKDDKDSQIWAIISDSRTSIPAKFTKKAMLDYNKTGFPPLTSSPSMVISICDFKPVFRRRPKPHTGNSSGPGMTRAAEFILEIGGVKFQGSSGESRRGEPATLEDHWDPDLKLYAENMRQDGGAGNVLKMRKDKKRAKDADVLAGLESHTPIESEISSPKPSQNAHASSSKVILNHVHTPRRPKRPQSASHDYRKIFAEYLNNDLKSNSFLNPNTPEPKKNNVAADPAEPSQMSALFAKSQARLSGSVAVPGTCQQTPLPSSRSQTPSSTAGTVSDWSESDYGEKSYQQAASPISDPVHQESNIDLDGNLDQENDHLEPPLAQDPDNALSQPAPDFVRSYSSPPELPKSSLSPVKAEIHEKAVPKLVQEHQLEPSQEGVQHSPPNFASNRPRNAQRRSPQRSILRDFPESAAEYTRTLPPRPEPSPPDPNRPEYVLVEASDTSRSQNTCSQPDTQQCGLPALKEDEEAVGRFKPEIHDSTTLDDNMHALSVEEDAQLQNLDITIGGVHPKEPDRQAIDDSLTEDEIEEPAQPLAVTSKAADDDEVVPSSQESERLGDSVDSPRPETQLPESLPPPSAESVFQFEDKTNFEGNPMQCASPPPISHSQPHATVYKPGRRTPPFDRPLPPVIQHHNRVEASSRAPSSKATTASTSSKPHSYQLPSFLRHIAEKKERIMSAMKDVSLHNKLVSHASNASGSHPNVTFSSTPSERDAVRKINGNVTDANTSSTSTSRPPLSGTVSLRKVSPSQGLLKSPPRLVTSKKRPRVSTSPDSAIPRDVENPRKKNKLTNNTEAAVPNDSETSLDTQLSAAHGKKRAIDGDARKPLPAAAPPALSEFDSHFPVAFDLRLSQPGLISWQKMQGILLRTAKARADTTVINSMGEGL